MNIQIILAALEQYKPIRVVGVKKDPYQLIIFSSAGRMAVADEGAEAYIDHEPVDLATFVDFLNSSEAGELKISGRHDRMTVQCNEGELHINADPKGLESLDMWTLDGANLIF